jgi:flagellar motor switch/type III secretory pathway protein FliN
MKKQKGLLDRIQLPTRIVVHRTELTTAALAAIVQKGELAPADGGTCELEAGGQVLARGKIVRKRGRYFFKVLETAKEGEK